MPIPLGRMSNVSGAGDPVTVCQTNFEILAEETNKVVATYQSGGPSTVIGPPVSGAHIVDEVWRDALGAWYRCTVAATPGTWRQEKPAVVATPPTTGTIPDGYWIQDASENFSAKYHLGSYAWRTQAAKLAYFSLTGLTGGTTGKLDSVPTVPLDAGITMHVVQDGEVTFYQLAAGTTAESTPEVVRPDDYNAGTNAKVWLRVTKGIVFDTLAEGAVAIGRFVTKGADNSHLKQCGTDTDPVLGVALATVADGAALSVLLLGCHVMKLLLGGSVSLGDLIMTDASGKAKKLTTGSGTYYIVGRALAGGNSGDTIQIQLTGAFRLIVP